MVPQPTIHLVIPAYNEAAILQQSIAKLYESFGNISENIRPTRVIVANNASTDATHLIAGGLALKYDNLTVIDVPEKGKGAAVMTAWQRFPADISVFLDADLATDLSVYPQLVDEIYRGADIAVGSRLLSQSRVKRSILRHILSRGLRLLLIIMFRLRTKDVACGAKAINARVLRDIVPKIQERDWSFDTELIIRAERQGYVVREIPVTWSDEWDAIRPSSVSLVPNVMHRLKSLIRLYKKI